MFSAHLSDLAKQPNSSSWDRQPIASTTGHYGPDEKDDSTLYSGATTPTRGAFTPSTTAAGSIAGDFGDAIDASDISLGPLHPCPSCTCRPSTVFSDADGPFDSEQLHVVISDAASTIVDAEVAISRKPKLVIARTDEDNEYIEAKNEMIADAKEEMLIAYYQLKDDDVKYRKYIDGPMSTVKEWTASSAKQSELVSLMMKGHGLPRDLQSAYSIARSSPEKMPLLSKRFRLASRRSDASGSTLRR